MKSRISGPAESMDNNLPQSQPHKSPDSLTSLMRCGRFTSQKHRKSTKKQKQENSKKSHRSIRNCLRLDSCKILAQRKQNLLIDLRCQDIKQECLLKNEGKSLVLRQEGQKLLIQKQQLIQFTRKFAQQKSDLQEQLNSLKQLMNQKSSIQQTSLKDCQTLNVQLRKQMQIMKLSSENTIKSLQNQLSCCQSQMIKMSKQMRSLKQKTEEQILETKRCRQFLKIKNQIIKNLEHRIRKQNGEFKEMRRYSCLETDNKQGRSTSLQSQKGVSYNMSKSPNKKRVRNDPILIDEGLEQKDEIKLTKRLSISDLKDCESISEKIEGLLAAVRDRDIQIARLKTQNSLLLTLQINDTHISLNSNSKMLSQKLLDTDNCHYNCAQIF